MVRRVFEAMLKRGSGAPKNAAPSVPTPELPVFVIGDLHGRFDLLEMILEQIDLVLGEFPVPETHLVFVGDYIDRGPDSRKVLKRLQMLKREFGDNVICLMGNHEVMMLEFLDNPVEKHGRWLRHGGMETCYSFGVAPAGSELTEQAAEMTAKRLMKAMGRDLVAWIREMPLRYDSGNMTVVHAGADPGAPMASQSDKTLLWGHPNFLANGRRDGHWVVHGHTVMPEPIYSDSRISIDTGAFSSDILTAAVIMPDGEVQFLQTN